MIDNVIAEIKIKATLFRLTPPYVKPNKHPAEGACSQFNTPIKIINTPIEIAEFK